LARTRFQNVKFICECPTTKQNSIFLDRQNAWSGNFESDLPTFNGALSESNRTGKIICTVTISFHLALPVGPMSGRGKSGTSIRFINLTQFSDTHGRGFARNDRFDYDLRPKVELPPSNSFLFKRNLFERRSQSKYPEFYCVLLIFMWNR
jgi:hypothetical protein